MGSQLSADGQYAQAICNFRRGIATLKKSTGNDRYLGHAWTGIAIAEWSLDGRGPAQALRSAKVAVDLLVNSPDDNVAKQIISSEDVLALCYFETGRH